MVLGEEESVLFRECSYFRGVLSLYISIPIMRWAKTAAEGSLERETPSESDGGFLHTRDIPPSSDSPALSSGNSAQLQPCTVIYITHQAA